MKRNEIEQQFKWNTGDIYVSDEAWQKSFDETEEAVKKMDGLREKFLLSGQEMHNVFKKINEISLNLEKVYVYSLLRRDEDSANTVYQAYYDKSHSLYVKLTSAISFIEPDLLSLGEGVIEKYINEEPELKLYEHYIENIVRNKEHILTAEMEEFLAKTEEIGQAPGVIYNTLHDADLKFPDIEDENGKLIPLSHGKFIGYMESPHRQVRINAFNALYDEYIKFKNTISSIYNASVKKDVFYAKARNFESALESKLFGNNIPVSVYKNLIDTVNNYLPQLHRYVKLRKNRLNLDELHMYDLYTPIVKDVDTNISFDDAKACVLKALEPMGSDYVSVVAKGFNEGWIDVYENDGKRSGAYSCGLYPVHPYVLLNYDGKLDDMYTLAHEMGHAMHSYLTSETQEYIYGDYTIFLAEVASTVNEVLLTSYLLKTETDKTKKEYILNKYLENFRGTLFRQTLFAEFEMVTHEMVEKGEPLTTDSLNKLYRELIIKYYGPDIVADDRIDYEWSRIPHFFRQFYVFQYATGFSAAVAFAARILKGGSNVGDYLEFLKSGSSDYSINILKKAGVDMSSPKPISEALDVFADLLTQMENL